ncbi:MAG: addB [Clostridiales bacterium]|jgi:ATP-dependent helicase/nuclease subunit B|nr:addB [Clostridiales bacterium]
MVLQLVLGSSGAGKSYYCTKEMIREARENIDDNYLMIVPEQFTLQTQLEMVSSSENKGILNIDVLSFNRLAHRIFEEVPGYNRPVIDDLGKTLILRKLLQTNKDKLHLIGRNVNKPGVIDEIKSIISELYQYGIEQKDLIEVANRHKNRQLGLKLEDISIIYKAFQDYMKEDKIIVAEEVLTLLSNAIEQSNIIRNTTICLDGFTGFTPVQYRLIEKLMDYAKKIIIPITLDEREVDRPIKDEHELFNLSKKTILKLKEIAASKGIDKVEQIVLGNGTTKRHEGNEELLHIEKNLFRFPYKTYTGEVNNITIASYKNPVNEVEEIAIKISNLVKNNGYRYKDIAVVSGSVEDYTHNIERTFNLYNIPFFIDNKKSMLDNPLSELVRSTLEIIDKDFSYDSVMHFLRTGLCNSYMKKVSLADADEEITITVDEIDKLENYILALGIRGKSRWSKTWDRTPRGTSKSIHLEDINKTRIKIYELLKDVYEVVNNKDNNISVKIEGIYDFLVCLDVEKKLEDLSEEFNVAGEKLLYREYKQINKIVIELFDKMYDVIGDEKASAKDLLQIIEAGLMEAKVGLVPPSIDQVVVGDVERTRLKDNKILFFIGVNDGLIPKASTGKSIINDNEREALELDNFELAPNQKRKLFIEQFYLYLNLTKPSEKLYISMCRVDMNGKTMRASYLVGRILKLFDKLEVQYVDTEVFTIDKVITAKNSIQYIVSNLNRIRNESVNDLFRELFTWYISNEQWSVNIEKLLDAAFYKNEQTYISKEIIKKLYSDTIISSVSKLENFSTCPYSFLMTYGIDLKERKEYEVSMPDIGNILHESIEKFAIRLNSLGLTWNDVDDLKRDEIVDNIVLEVAEIYDNNVLTTSCRNKYMISRLQRIAKRTVWALQSHLNVGEFTPLGYEIKFDSLSNKLKTLNLKLNNDTSLELVGKIDRVDSYETEQDVYIKVIDYKSGSTKLTLEKVLSGLQLQLFVYMYAAVELVKEQTTKKVKPAAALYYNILDPIVDKDENSQDSKEQIEEKILEKLKMNGLVINELSLIKKMDNKMEVKSSVLPVEFKKDGLPSSRASVASEYQFDQLEGFIQNKIKEIGNKIAEGDTSITPYKYEATTGCDYCSYQGICKFDKKLGNKFNNIGKLSSKDEFWNYVNKVKTGGEAHVD